MAALRLILTLFAIAILLYGCGSTSGSKRGKLSEAMEVASNHYEGKRHLDTQQQPASVDTEPDESETLTSALATDATDDDPLVIGGDGRISSFGYQQGHGVVGGNKFRSQNSHYLSLGFREISQWQTAFFTGMEFIEVNPASSLYQSVSNDLTLLSLGAKANYLFRGRQQMIRPYLMGGFAASYLLWNYNNRFTTSTGSTVGSDSVSGFSLHVGAGLAIQPAKSIRINAEISPRLHLWDDTTRLGFENDVFGTISLTETNISFSLLI